MRIPATILFGLSLLLAVSGADAQTGRCKDGTASTMTGTIGTIQQFRPEPGVNIWVMKGNFGGNCRVEQIWGDGNAPKSCSAGKSFTATGKVVDADSFWMLQAKSITCN